jgi:SAM-dependent methyltransferase
MHDDRRLAFGSVGEQYDRFRPSYPGALIDDVLAFAGAAPGALPRVLEVGAGTGKATVLFAARGASVLALEPDPGMASVARRNCEPYPAVTLAEAEFERWDPDGASFDLVVCAQAWHWITPEVRTTKARAVLADGGALALFWNRPLWERCSLADAIRVAYANVPDFGPRPGPMHPDQSGEQARALWGDHGGELDLAAGLELQKPRRYEWKHDYTAAEYVSLIGTHSDHILLPEQSRQMLLSDVSAAIDAAGGRFTLDYVTHLLLARAT